MRIGVVTFPGSLDDHDAARAVREAGGEAQPLWHADTSIAGIDAVVLPGGFSYGDYLRAGAIASMTPIMSSVIAAARRGLPVLGICNGFQILCEAGLLPGALTRNAGLKFICRPQLVRIANTATAWSNQYQPEEEVRIPLKNIDGRFVADQATLDMLEAEGRVVMRYLDGNPNGSMNAIAGITNESGNVVGMMPHPEHATSDLVGAGTGGLRVFASVLHQLTNTTTSGS